jgi:hypothetical protein
LDKLMVENMRMFYDEVRDRLVELGILTATEIDRQHRVLGELVAADLPAAWGIHRVVCEV